MIALPCDWNPLSDTVSPIWTEIWDSKLSSSTIKEVAMDGMDKLQAFVAELTLTGVVIPHHQALS